MKIGPVGSSGPGGVADWQTARTAKLPRAGRLGVFLITAKLPWRFGTADGYVYIYIYISTLTHVWLRPV